MSNVPPDPDGGQAFGCPTTALRRAHRITDTGEVRAIDLNADLAEGDTLSLVDRALLDVVTSASLACGFHAGGRRVMRAAAELCLERGVAIGAHISFRDRQGFGRRTLDVTTVRLAADLVEQWETLEDEVSMAGGRVTYIKPHGALYHSMATDPVVAATVVATLAPHCTILVGPPGGALAGPASAAAVTVVPEGFCDRGYDARGQLVPRGGAGDLIDDPAEVGERARSMATEGRVRATDGTWVTLSVRTLCIHGDQRGAVRRGRAARDALIRAGVDVRAFAPSVNR